MRIALAQINPTVGDIAHNCEKILRFAADAARLNEIRAEDQRRMAKRPPWDKDQEQWTSVID